MSQHPVDIAANLAREWERRAKDAESQNQALQEALEKIRDDKGDVVHGGYGTLDTALAALRSLRTQLEQVTRERDEARADITVPWQERDAQKFAEYEAQHTKDREEIERLRQLLYGTDDPGSVATMPRTKDQERIASLEEQLTKKWWNKREHELEDVIAKDQERIEELGLRLRLLIAAIDIHPDGLSPELLKAVETTRQAIEEGTTDRGRGRA